MKYILFIYLSLAAILSVNAQIGINTNNPKYLLHIDGASTAATTNPITGTVTEAQAADDVVIDNNGNIGVGTLTPSTKLHIKSATAGAIKIVDGTQGINKVLLSDANGVGTWGSVFGSWFAVLAGSWLPVVNTYTERQFLSFSESIVSSTEGGVNAATGTIIVPYTGKYRITMSGHWTGRTGITVFKSAAILKVNNANYWAPYTAGNTTIGGVYPTFSMIGNLNANDILTVFSDEKDANSANWCVNFSITIEFIK